MAKHAGTAHGYARDIGAARQRVESGRARYGKHGVYTARHSAGRASLMRDITARAGYVLRHVFDAGHGVARYAADTPADIARARFLASARHA